MDPVVDERAEMDAVVEDRFWMVDVMEIMLFTEP